VCAISVVCAMESGGFTLLHVSGLDAYCEDEYVEADFRRILGSNAAESTVAGADAAEAGEGQLYGCENNCGFQATFDVVCEHEKTCDVSAAPVAPAAEVPEDAPGAEPAVEVTRSESDDSPGKDASGGYPVADAATDPQPEAVEAVDDLAADDGVLPFSSFTVVRNKDTLECKGYCFLGFTSPEAANRAMEKINAGAEVGGCVVKAQISVQKERHAKPKEEELGDLRLRRQRYANYGSKKQQLGHVTCSDPTKKAMSVTGKINTVHGTRGGNHQQFENDLKKTTSGFACAK